MQVTKCGEGIARVYLPNGKNSHKVVVQDLRRPVVSQRRPSQTVGRKEWGHLLREVTDKKKGEVLRSRYFVGGTNFCPSYVEEGYAKERAQYDIALSEKSQTENNKICTISRKRGKKKKTRLRKEKRGFNPHNGLKEKGIS